MTRFVEPSADHLFSPMRETFDLDVGVIYTHERELVKRLLTTIRDSADGPATRLILVDNHSVDGIEPWRGIVPATFVLRNSERLGYAVNLNRILASSSARYVLLLNTDMYFDPSNRCLARMVEFMDAHPDCGIAGCRLYHADGSDAWAARQFQTASVILARRFGLGRVLHKTVDRYLNRHRDPSDSFECDWLSGCFMMVRREAIEAVGLFDESFGKYFEDVDICRRMAKAGWRVMYHGDANCYHLEQRASRSLMSVDAWRHLRAYLYWLSKWGLAGRRNETESRPAVCR